MGYIPHPIDTSNISVPLGVLEVAEILSRNTHEVWASGKIRDGYTYGNITDEAQKTHQNLIPYEELSASERAYDMSTALETVKVLLKLGFKIERAAK